MCCSKFILFASNAIIFILGVAVVALASVTISRGSEYWDLLLEGTFTLPVLILILGLIVITIGFLGCFGALRESKCMLYTYSGIVLALFIGMIVIASLIIANPEQSKDAIESLLDKQFRKYGGVDATLTKSIDNMQHDLECCGVQSYTEYNDYPAWSIKHTDEAPWSCCSNKDSSDDVCKFNSPNIYKTGCMVALVYEFQDITLALGIAGLILAIFMFFSMSTACGLARRSNYEK